jgi:hypothetical protein
VFHANIYLIAPKGGNHYGGSCQIGFSVDNGTTFRTAVSYEGNCPHRHGGEDPSGQTFNFTVPEDLPTGDVIFAWAWINREVEFNMNCAAVSITNGDSGRSSIQVPAPSAYANFVEYPTSSAIPCTVSPRSARLHRHAVPFNSRPEMFVADVHNGCLTPNRTAELKYPNPGPDIVEGDGDYPLALPLGTC